MRSFFQSAYEYVHHIKNDKFHFLSLRATTRQRNKRASGHDINDNKKNSRVNTKHVHIITQSGSERRQFFFLQKPANPYKEQDCVTH